MPDWQNRSGALGDRNERGRREHAAGPVVPSDQRLEPDDASGSELDLRLVVELEFALVQGDSQLFRNANPAHAPQGRGRDYGSGSSPAAVALGAVEGKIGLHHHRVRTGDVGRELRDADARGDADLVALNAEGNGEQLADPCRKLACSLRIGDLWHENGEFVAAEPRDQVFGPDGAPQPADDLLQQQVAQGMAERVIHIGEPLEEGT